MQRIAHIFKEGRERRMRGERGATPIEILAGLVLLGIIFSFVIVKFFSWRETTQDKGAQSNIRNATLAAESVYTSAGDYGTAAVLTAARTAAVCDGVDGNKNLNCVEPELTFTSTATALTKGGKEIFVSVADAEGPRQVITFATWSSTGRMWCARVVSDDGYTQDVGTYYGGGNKAANSTAASACSPTRTKY